ncbi:helix-turn-helix transcriptional regulator [Frankia sp. AgB1.9]|uniref:PadR family transcriptional regulator n=1 Tax=unclassified Frankia TaxID=2632575 RepID=UPI001931552B|nr:MULTISPECIES: PadR family transcriptional regulator [unclassified Frankia]MBL7492230.1 helix-turn-helix transcriptional regulator [Frankia sp. AgW1.1]MBL7553560.1 helix-turn-helix transcriptional regulator [Frankia sp. AgB1.9]MBL7623695.1 helix-turn-helix transcriptional regulator [Frankia sp. AgB1.8]
MAPAHDPQLLKGVLSLLLLRLLAERESYGYEIVQRLRELGLSDISEGSVYPALARLEREGRVQTRLVASRSGPARKYYRPTAAGSQALAEGTASWLSLAAVVHPVLVRSLPDPAPATEDT